MVHLFRNPRNLTFPRHPKLQASGRVFGQEMLPFEAKTVLKWRNYEAGAFVEDKVLSGRQVATIWRFFALMADRRSLMADRPFL